MKHTILIFVFVCVSFAKLWATECTVVIEEKAKFFLQQEINSALTNSIGNIFAIDNIKIITQTQPTSKACHFKIIITIYTNVVSTYIYYAGDEFVGGSPKLNHIGIQEAIIRAFYKKQSFREKTCRLFGEKYNLNCILYKKE